MRRLFVAATACAAFLLVAGGAAADTQRHVNGGVHPGPATAPAPGAGLSKARFAPLGARLAATATVIGTLYDSYHNALSGKTVEWDSWSTADQTWYWDTTTTAADGSYSMTALATSVGEVWAYPDDDTMFARLNQTWSAGGSYSVPLYPGRVAVSATRGGPWTGSSSLAVHLFGDTAYSHQDLAAPDASSSPIDVTMTALDGTYDAASVNFFYDEGVEFSGPIAVTSGAASATTITVDESDAQRVWSTAPRFASGKPGTTVRLTRDNFPTGWKNRVTGHSDPDYSAQKTFGVKTSQGGAAESVSVKVPATAKPGYGYWIGFQHVDAGGSDLPLYVEEMFQVCTMKPSKASITKGTRIRIKGVVPTEGHWGDQAGRRKAIAVWWHKGTAGVPTNWDKPQKQGWVLVSSMKTTGTGSYTTPSLKPPRTGTFVVQYAGDDWYWGAFTSTARVKVR